MWGAVRSLGLIAVLSVAAIANGPGVNAAARHHAAHTQAVRVTLVYDHVLPNALAWGALAGSLCNAAPRNTGNALSVDARGVLGQRQDRRLSGR